MQQQQIAPGGIIYTSALHQQNTSGASSSHALATSGYTSDSKTQGKDKGVDEGITSISSQKIDWIIDLGATDCMTFYEEDLINHMKSRKTGILNSNGDKYLVTCKGDVKISKGLTLKNTLLVPSLSTTLISVG